MLVQTPRFMWILATLLLLSWRGFASGQEAPDLESRLAAVPDYLTFARGAIPLAPGGDAGPLKTAHEQALAAIDGNPASYVLTPKPGGPETVIELIYELPAATTFSWFGVPGISETPSPSQTFVARIDVFGSAEGPDGAFVPLGGADLTTHAERGQISGFKADAAVPMSERFNGKWKGRGVLMELRQDGALVTGCWSNASPATTGAATSANRVSATC